MDNKYLDENKYKKNKKALIILSILILLIGFSIGGYLIYKGIDKTKIVNNTYSEESKQEKINKLNDEINIEKTNLEAKKAELISKGLSASSDYDSGEAYDLYIITKVLDPSFSYWKFDEYKNHSLTAKYCALKTDLDEIERMDVDFQRDFNNFDSMPFYMIGGVLILLGCVFAGEIFKIAKGREILAFKTQQVAPVAKEGIDTMAPSIGKVAKEIKDNLKDK